MGMEIIVVVTNIIWVMSDNMCPHLLHGGVHHLNVNLGNHLVRHVHICRQAILLGVCRELGVLLNHLLNDARVALLNLIVSYNDLSRI